MEKYLSSAQSKHNLNEHITPSGASSGLTWLATGAQLSAIVAPIGAPAPAEGGVAFAALPPGAVHFPGEVRAKKTLVKRERNCQRGAKRAARRRRRRDAARHRRRIGAPDAPRSPLYIEKSFFAKQVALARATRPQNGGTLHNFGAKLRPRAPTPAAGLAVANAAPLTRTRQFTRTKTPTQSIKQKRKKIKKKSLKI